MPINGALTQKEKALVAVGASIAAGCQPCTAYHFRAARAAGAGEEEIRCATNLEMHLASARRLGATERQLQTTLAIARMVKKVAGQKVEAAVEMATAAPAKASDGCDDDCGCHAGKGQPSQVTKESAG